MTKRIIAMLAALLMLLPLAVGCKKKEDVPGETTVTTTDGGSSGEKVTSRYDPNSDVLDTLPTTKYGGKEFSIKVAENHYYQFDAEKINGDLANDTLYNWINKIEKRYDVDVAVYKGAGWTAYNSEINAEITAGVDIKNLYGIMAFMAYSGILNGMYKNWYGMGDNIDLNTERWDKEVNDGVTYNGALYGLTGSLGISKMQYTMATFYDVERLDNLGYSTSVLCKMVDDNEWTFENFSRIVKDIYEDLDNSQTISDGDLFGYVSASGNSLDIWFPAFDISITSRDNANKITPTLYTDSNVEILTKLCNFYHNNQGVRIFDITKTSESALFAKGQAAMVSARFYSAFDEFSQMGSDAYGILPLPKLDAGQEHYVSKLNDQYTLWCVAKTLPESENDFTAHITDALCAESSTTVYYQFYDIILKSRYSKDGNTARMVDIVMDYVSFDTAIMFGEYLDGYPYMIRKLIQNNSTDIASEYNGKAESIKQKLQTVYDCYQ